MDPFLTSPPAGKTQLSMYIDKKSAADGVEEARRSLYKKEAVHLQDQFPAKEAKIPTADACQWEDDEAVRALVMELEKKTQHIEDLIALMVQSS
mmetsp:Transcript_14048/g.32536  ORF Transcript_14048/g.32536 Transcript_14048/m.32536 type:complete len:94 (+) Transcript_14048:2-283(+)